MNHLPCRASLPPSKLLSPAWNWGRPNVQHVTSTNTDTQNALQRRTCSSPPGAAWDLIFSLKRKLICSCWRVRFLWWGVSMETYGTFTCGQLLKYSSTTLKILLQESFLLLSTSTPLQLRGKCWPVWCSSCVSWWWAVHDVEGEIKRPPSLQRHR